MGQIIILKTETPPNMKSYALALLAVVVIAQNDNDEIPDVQALIDNGADGMLIATNPNADEVPDVNALIENGADGMLISPNPNADSDDDEMDSDHSDHEGHSSHSDHEGHDHENDGATATTTFAATVISILAALTY